MLLKINGIETVAKHATVNTETSTVASLNPLFSYTTFESYLSLLNASII